MTKVTGEAAGEIRQLVPDIETLARRLADIDYLVDEGLATSMFLSLRLPQPLLLEGEAGVGKTEAAKSLAPLVSNDAMQALDEAEVPERHVEAVLSHELDRGLGPRSGDNAPMARIELV